MADLQMAEWMPKNQFCGDESAEGKRRYVGNHSSDMTVGEQYLIRVGCDSANYFKATYLGLAKNDGDYHEWLVFDNGVYAEDGGCGLGVYQVG